MGVQLVMRMLEVVGKSVYRVVWRGGVSCGNVRVVWKCESCVYVLAV